MQYKITVIKIWFMLHKKLAKEITCHKNPMKAGVDT